MRIKSYLSSTLFGCLIFLSCDPSTGLNPEISIISPLQSETLSLSQDLVIEADLFDDFELHSYSIKLDTEEGLNLFSDSGELDSYEHTLRYRINLTALDNTSLNIKLEVKDHEGNKTKESIWFDMKWK